MGTRNRFWLKLTATCVALSLFPGVAACTTAAPTATSIAAPTSVASPKPASAPGTTPVQTPAPTSPAVSKPEGVLKVALSTFGPDQMDPMLDTSNARQRTGAMFDTWLSATPDGELAPGLTKSWEMSPDGKYWTFNVRQGVLWQDGWGEVTANDLKFSLERNTSKESKTSFAASLRDSIASIDVVDNYTVRVNLKAADISLPYKLSFLKGNESMVVPKRYIEEKGVEEFRRKPIGSGPWKFVRHASGSLYEFEAVTDPAFYKNHYRQMPAFARLEIRMVPDAATQLAMLKTGEVDVIDLSPEQVDEAEKAGLRVAQVPMAFQYNLHFWTTYRTPDVPTANLKVRQALNLAINREELVKFLFNGKGSSEVLPPRVFPTNESASWKSYGAKTYTYDPKRAKDILAEAGYSNGFDLKIWSYAQVGAPAMVPMAEALSTYFRNVGVKAQIAPIEYGTALNMWRAKPQDTKLDGTVSLLYAPPRPFSEAANDLNGTFASNGSQALLRNPDLDKTLALGMGEVNASKRQEAVQQAIQMTADSMTAIPVVYSSSFVGVSKKVGTWTPIRASETWGLSYEKATRP